MPLRLEDLPEDIQKQIMAENDFAPEMDNGASLNWGGLSAEDIGGDVFGADDVLELGLGALSAISPNASAITNIGNLAGWGLRQIPEIVSLEGLGELGIGFGAEAIGDPGGDLADLSTRDEDMLGMGFSPFG